MTPQEALDLFYEKLSRHFHHGHEKGHLDRVYKEVMEAMQAEAAKSGSAAVQAKTVDAEFETRLRESLYGLMPIMKARAAIAAIRTIANITSKVEL